MSCLQISDKGAVREPDYPHWNDTSKHFFSCTGLIPPSGRAAPEAAAQGNGRFFAKLPPTEIGMEACGAAHTGARAA